MPTNARKPKKGLSLSLGQRITNQLLCLFIWFLGGDTSNDLRGPKQNGSQGAEIVMFIVIASPGREKAGDAAHV